MAERGQLGRGTDGSGHKAGFVRRAVGIGDLPCQFCGPLIESKRLIFESVFRQNDGGGTERIRLNHVAAGFEKLPMHGLDRIGPGEHQLFVAALQGRTAEVLGRQVHLLQ